MGPATCGDSATTVWTYWDKLTLPPFEAACLETWRALNPQHNVEVHENDHHPQRSIADPSRSPPPSTLRRGAIARGLRVADADVDEPPG